MFERITDPIFAPLRLLRSKIFRVKQLPSNIKGEIGRFKNEARMYGAEAKGAASSAKGAGARAQAAAQGAQQAKPQTPKKRKMGWFSKKRKCEGCGQKLHPSWSECPYCGFGKAAAAPAATAPAGGSPQRTIALDTRAVAPPGTGMLGWFIPLEGSRMGELITLRGRVSVGSSPDNDVVISDPSISGRHCEFVGSEGGFKLVDLGSTNGTFVNDKPERVQTHDLVDNDGVRLGRVRFKFKSLA